MASPQVENGYTKLANEILEKLSLPGINGSEYRVIIFVVRKTYGFHKKQDRISLTQFQKGTLMDRKSAVETIKSLVGKNILVKTGSVYRFNKNWEEWLVGKRPPSGQKTTGVVGNSPPKVVGKSPHTKEKKDTITKDIATEVAGREIVELINLFQEVNPSYEILFNNRTQRSACSRMIKKHGLEKMKNTVSLLSKIISMPYAPKITTPYELERDFGKLGAFYKQEVAKGQKSTKFSFN